MLSPTECFFHIPLSLSPDNVLSSLTWATANSRVSCLCWPPENIIKTTWPQTKPSLLHIALVEVAIQNFGIIPAGQRPSWMSHVFLNHGWGRQGHYQCGILDNSYDGTVRIEEHSKARIIKQRNLFICLEARSHYLAKAHLELRHLLASASSVSIFSKLYPIVTWQ